MARLSSSAGSGELAPRRAVQMVLRSLQANQVDHRANWTLRLAALKVPDPTRTGLHHLLQFLLRNLETALYDEPALIRSFQAEVLRAQPAVGAADVWLLLSFVEELVMSVVWRQPEVASPEAMLGWIRGVCRELGRAALSEAYFPVKNASCSSEAWNPPLVQWLNAICPSGAWQWFALVRNRPELSVVEIASYDTATKRWFPTVSAPEQTEWVRERVTSGASMVMAVSPDLTAVAAGEDDDFSVKRFRYLASWLRVALDLAAYQTAQPHRVDKAALYEVLLDFDEALLTAADLTDLLTTVVQRVCRHGGFKRSALFLYNPITQSVEGVHGHNVNVDEIQRIRESDRNIPALGQFIQVAKPVFLHDVTSILPDTYVRYFRLTSLLVCPLMAEDKRPIGIMLLDQGGRPFQPDDRTVRMVETMLTRAARCIVNQMYKQSGPPPVAAITTLTNREREILQLIADGVDTKEIGKQLHISDYTVTEHVSSILRKLNVKNRTEAVAKALREQIIR